TAADCDRQTLRLETTAATRAARQRHHVLLELLANRLGRRLFVASHDVREHALPWLAVRARRAARTVRELDLALARAVQDAVARLLRQLAPRRVRVEVVVLRESGNHRLAQVARRLAPRQDHTLEDRDDRVTDHEIRTHLATRAEAAAAVARTVRRVERELSRLELGHARAAVHAGVAFAEEMAFGLRGSGAPGLRG